MNDRELFFSLIQENINQMSQIIEYLSAASNPRVRNKFASQLRRNVFTISVLMQGLQKNLSTNHPQPGGPRILTPEELSVCNGKNGNPAYVAVNGMIYDVTDHAAWAGATHFGLTAGRDLSGEFAACHAGGQILKGLKVVGWLIG